MQPQILGSESASPISIPAESTLLVQAGLQFPASSAAQPAQPAEPHFVKLSSLCPFLSVQETFENGTFLVYNPTTEEQTFTWTAHHLHSDAQEPLHQQPTQTSPGPAPPALCPLPSTGGDLQNYMLGSYWLNVLETIEAAREKTADIILTDTDPGALQAAITAASNGDCLEVQTDATYDPVIIPAAKELIVRAGQGNTPAISGQYALQLTNGAQNVIIAGFTFPNCTTANQNAKGAAVSMLADGAIVQGIHFDNCTFPEISGTGSAVMISYHIAAYASPPQQNELSDGISFVECTFDHACKDAIEGAALNVRACKRFFAYQCDLDGKDADPGSRGIQLQNCPEFLIFGCDSFNHSNGNGEAYKADTIGSPVAVLPSGHLIKSTGSHSIEGIDIDDNAVVTVIDCLTHDNQDEGISVDDSATALLVNNKSFDNDDGIRLENGAEAILENNHCYGNLTNNYNLLNGYTLPGSNIDGQAVPTETDQDKKQEGFLPKYNLEGNPNGEMYVDDDDPGETPIGVIDQWEEVTLSVVAGVQDRVLFRSTVGPPPTARLKVGISGNYQVVYSASLASAAANQTFDHGVAINNATPTAKAATRRRYSSSDIGVIAGSAILYLNASDEIRFMLRNKTTTANITVSFLNVQLHKI
jgi:parallel beta-helix repeat protein